MSTRCLSEGRSLYRINDKDATQGCHPLANFKEADEWNARGWGVFWTVNAFNGPRRKENCTEVISWAVDLDVGSKADQTARIRGTALVPSAVIETARGHHVYFDAKPGASPDRYREIVERLVEHYDGDKNAKDVCRILRVPGYAHQKGTAFSIKLVFSSEQTYSEEEMLKAFPLKSQVPEIKAEQKQRQELKQNLSAEGDNLWEKVWSLNCEDALKRISGTEAMSFESVSFKRTSSGNLNIIVNDKPTSCWIDSCKRIGSSDKGGPTIANWINWYQRDWKKTVRLLKQFFPEVSQ